MLHNNYIGIIAVLLVGAITYLFIVFWNKRLRDASLNLGISSDHNKITRIILTCILIVFLFYLDFVRDYVFHNLSWRMDYQYLIEQGGSPDKYVDPTDSWMKAILGNASSNTIYLLKYVSSGIFILLYGFLSHLILRLIYPSNNTLPYTILLYGLGTLSMGLVFSCYFFQWSHDTKLNFYLIAMEIGHFLESSLPTLLSILGFKIYLSSQELKPNE
ncbi:hypothetical protein [Parvicella tangerina]|uniref:Uncharacterized protein n=1 Tax=Parvicella tangerina TaxID=2829795 RepID=A0A916JLN5_9FLAO|nr:hypothetical protein [Parvicella tangerina]CAG5079683.1 hypothetical protein CRYO30217_01014 [Parvicella tangerina]